MFLCFHEFEVEQNWSELIKVQKNGLIKIKFSFDKKNSFL